MARLEHDREDLLREAVALVERVELRLPDYPESFVAGFRRDGSASFYFGADHVLQFNARGEFRRGFDQGRLLKAVRGKLVSLRRLRDEREVTLLSHELSAEELSSFHGRMLRWLRTLGDALHLVPNQGAPVQVLGQVPPDKDVLARVVEWLDRNVPSRNTPDREFPIATAPNVGSDRSPER